MKKSSDALFMSLVSLAAFTASALTEPSVDWAAYKASPTPNSVMLTFAKGANSRGFAWQTDATVSESKVWILEGDYGESDAATFEKDGRLFTGSSTTIATSDSHYNSTINRHKVLATKLRPRTKYSYRLGGGGQFVYGQFTLNDVQDEVNILYMSDAQTQDMTKLFMWENTASRAAAKVGKDLDFIIYGGDLYDENSPQLKPAKYRQWGISADSATPYFKGIPWAFSHGNHDYTVHNDTTAIDYDKTVTVGGVTLGCQSFDYGRVHVVTLPYLGGWNDSNYGAVATWLDADLKQARQSGNTDWIVVAMHWGVYVTGDHYVDVGGSKNLLVKFAPIMSANHVDLVLQAHDHVFTKTLPYRWDAAGYTTTFNNSAVVNLTPATQTIDGESYDVDPNGTYYVCTGCAGHRCGENEIYANAELNNAKCYRNATYKIETGKVNVNSGIRSKGDNASADLSADMFGVLKVKGDTLAYDWYVVATNGLSSPVLFDTLRVKKTLAKAKRFSATPYLQHPATNAMSVIWFTRESGAARIAWQKDGASAWLGDALTSGVWAEALTNNLYAKESGVWGKQYRHRHRITGLEAATKYRYVVELDGIAYTNTFKTAPGKDSSVRFIYYNDPETAPGDKCTKDWTNPSNGATREYYVTKNVGYASNIVHMVKREPDLFVIAGDLAYQGGMQENWDEFWKHNAGGNGLGYNDPAGSVPIVAAIGNHDLQDVTGEPSIGRHCENGSGGESAITRYLSYFEYEPNGVNYTIGDGETFYDHQMERSQNFHRLDYGPITFLFMDANNGNDDDPEQDTNTGLFTNPLASSVKNKDKLIPCRSPDFNPGSKQYNWLTNNLADAQRNSKFTFVVCHQCPYSVGYHNCTNLIEYGGKPSTYSNGEWLSARALRILDETMIKYGVDGWLCGHDEMMEHSQITGKEILPDGTTRNKTVNIFDMGTAGDGLRGGAMTSESKLRNPPRNPKEVWRAHLDCPEVWENGILVAGGKHYGHAEINVTKETDGRWKCVITPVYIFVSKDKSGNPCKFERRIYDDVVTIYNEPSHEKGGLSVIFR